MRTAAAVGAAVVGGIEDEVVVGRGRDVAGGWLVEMVVSVAAL